MSFHDGSCSRVVRRQGDLGPVRQTPLLDRLGRLSKDVAKVDAENYPSVTAISLVVESTHMANCFGSDTAAAIPYKSLASSVVNGEEAGEGRT